MKVTPEHYARLEAAIKPLDKPEYRDQYRERRIVRAETVKDIDERYRWDLYWYAARLNSGAVIDSTDGYTMNHIDTALRRIVPLLEPTAR